ncbi:MAG: glutamine synthetase, partial [Hyphomicrobiales bacterium]
MSSFDTEYRSFCARHGTPERIELMLCDLNAVLRGKWLPGDAADRLGTGGVRLPLSTYAPNILGCEVEATGLGIVAGDPDAQVVPIPGSLRPVPWARGQVAQVQVEMAEGADEISALSSRGILNRLLSRFKARGLRPVVATELEFYVFKARSHADDAPQPPERTPEAQNYDLEVLARHEALLHGIQEAAKAQGLLTDTLIAEYGPGQFEVNFHHTDDVLLAADTALMFRRLVRGV